MRKFYREKLDNGVTILFERRDLPLVSVSAAIKSGFSYESVENKGISHLIEHLVHQGTKTRTQKDIAREVEGKGGVMNAFTDEEVTAFWNKMPSKYFNVASDIVSDLMLNPNFDKNSFEKEKKVVLEEINMHKDMPQRYVLEKIKGLLYEKPFGISGLGTEKSIANLKRENLINYYKNRYKSNKVILCVVGNTTIGKVREFGEKFPSSKGSKDVLNPAKINKQVVEKRGGLTQANIVVGYHVAPLGKKERYCRDVFEAILGQGASSRLFEEIREKKGLAYDIRSFLDRGNNYGYGAIYAGTTKDMAGRCKELILQEIKKMKDLEKSDFEEGKEKVIGLRKVGSEEGINVMHQLIEEEVAGDARNFYKYEDKINKVKLKDVRKLADIKDYSSLTLLPK